MFERFTDRARRVVVLAQEHARQCDHTSIEPEHLLIALLKEGEGVAWQALTNVCPVSFAIAAKAQENLMRVPTSAGLGTVPQPHIPFNATTKKVLELSMREALQLGHNYIGTEHLLLAIIRHDDTAAECIKREGVTLEGLRREVINILSGYRKEQAERTKDAREEVSDVIANVMEKLVDATQLLATVADKLK
jgi:ATP-dependent Clp protease ATP-binding subunit ClpC